MKLVVVLLVAYVQKCIFLRSCFYVFIKISEASVILQSLLLLIYTLFLWKHFTIVNGVTSWATLHLWIHWEVVHRRCFSEDFSEKHQRRIKIWKSFWLRDCIFTKITLCRVEDAKLLIIFQSNYCSKPLCKVSFCFFLLYNKNFPKTSKNLFPKNISIACWFT